MKKFIPIGSLIAIAVALFVIFGFAKTDAPKSEANTYKNEKYGISFEYPDGYVLTEGEKGDAHRGHYAVVLVKQEDAAPREGGEGPTAVTVDIYQNDIDNLSVSDWVLNTNAANFKLSDGTYTVTTVGGAPALTNGWSGLYEGVTTTLLHKKNAVTVTATYFDRDDRNLKAYDTVLRTFTLTGGETAIKATPERVTLSGSFMCLGYKDAGPHNQNCVPGIITNDGKKYELDTMLMSQTAPALKPGDMISANGVIVLSRDLGIEWGMHNYDALGKFSVTDSLLKK